MKRTVRNDDLNRGAEAGNQKPGRRAFMLALAVLLTLACGLVGGETQTVPTATVAAAPTDTAIPSPTATPLPASVSAAAPIACLSGPGDAYAKVIDLQAGEKAEIVGKSSGYWVVKTPAGSECWVPEQGVTSEGDLTAVAEVAPPATPLPTAPSAPAYLQLLDANCLEDRSVKPLRYINQFHLTWQDTSNNEDGFHVYRDGDRVGELPAGKTEMVDEIIAQNNKVHYYYVTSYNAVGETKSEPIALTCEGGGGGGGGAPGPGPGPGPSGP